MPPLVLKHTVEMNVLAKGFMELVSFLAVAVILLKGLRPLNDFEKRLVEKALPPSLKPLICSIF